MDWADSSAQSLRGRDGSKGSGMGSIALLRAKKTKKVCMYVRMYTVGWYSYFLK